MVNKGSFFQRLKDRWGSGSGVRLESSTGRAGQSAAATSRSTAKPAATSARVEPERSSSSASSSAGSNGGSSSGSNGGSHSNGGSNGGAHSVSTSFAPAEARSARKMSEREEALMAVGSHFQELTALMRGSQAKTDEKLQKLVDATASLGSLPALSQQQLDMLKGLSAQMERQNQLGEQLSTTMTRLPTLLENVETALQRAAATDERTAATVKEFQSTMDRIHSSMDSMVKSSSDELKGLASDISKTQATAVEQLKRTTDEGLQTLRRTHEDQSNRLQRIVQEHAGWNRAVLVGVGLVVLGIGAIIVLQLIK